MYDPFLDVGFRHQGVHEKKSQISREVRRGRLRTSVSTSLWYFVLNLTNMCARK
jgi:hypothetical protein